MASSCHCSPWEAPTFHFNSPNQSEDWSVFDTRALDYVDAFDIEPEVADQACKGWKQLKLMFEGEDRKALQSLIDSGVVTAEHMLTPKAALDAIATTIKSEEHFWAHRDELMSDFQHQPDEGIHVLSQCICDPITNSKFTHAPTVEMIKIIVIQHAVKYHEARDWIRQQDQSQLTYQALLSHCKMLKVHCKQYQKAKGRGHTDLASITAATFSLHLDAISKSKPHCNKCGYLIQMVNVQQKGCRQNKKQQRVFKPNKCSYSHGHHSSHSPHNHRHRSHSSCSHSRTPSCIPSHNPTCGASPRYSPHSKRHSTTHRYYEDAIDVIPADSITTGSRAEASSTWKVLLMVR